jgi:hypothetical protein
MAKVVAAGIYQEPEVEGLVTDYVANKGNNTLIKLGHPRTEPLPRPGTRRHRPRRQARPRRTTTVSQGRRHFHSPIRLRVRAAVRLMKIGRDVSWMSCSENFWYLADALA